MQWSEEGIISSFKFIQKLWNLNTKILEEIKRNHQKDKDKEITKFTNKLIKKVTENLENFSYNKIVANLHEMYSFMYKQIGNGYSKKTLLDNYKNILILMLPVIPHFANECLEVIKIKGQNLWPEFNKDLIEEDEVNIVIQINGRKREVIKSQRNTSEENLLKLIMINDKLSKYFDKNQIKKKIYIKDKLINIILQ